MTTISGPHVPRSSPGTRQVPSPTKASAVSQPSMTASRSARQNKPTDGGKLRIGDDWNAIRIIALSQSNPLKAIAEFVENSIDAHAKTIAITRGREHGGHYLTVKDDGDGVPRDPNGVPDFQVRRDSYLRLDQATPEG